ncbi:MAG TPA: kelch repeat-containing protein [Myxococcaceae bacterium]
MAAAGCGPRETEYQLRLITDSCAAPSPMEGVTHFLFRVTGTGIAAPIEVSGLATARQLTLPPIPVGANRVVEVRGYNGDPRSGLLVSLGRTLPFDVPGIPARLPQDLTVFLRPKNSLLPISLSISPESCTKMGWPHAGHSATVLRDGKVLIAGGFSFNLATGDRVASIHAELFDPATGGFSDLPDLASLDAQQSPVLSPRAFHSANLVEDGKVLLAGGETYVGADPTPRPRGDALLFDPQARTYRLLDLGRPRSQHGGISDSGARVLFLGGITIGGAQALALEWYDPARTVFTDVPGEQLGRVQMGTAAVQGGQYVVVAGGSDGVAVSDEVRLYGFDVPTSTFVLLSTARLLEPRRAPALSWVGDPVRVVAAGGYSNLSEITGVSPLASTEVVVSRPQFQVSSGPNIGIARGDACAATLPDGRVLVSGGRGADFNLAARSMENVELIVQSSTGGPPSVLGLPSLARGRFFHTCTPLKDGTLLIAGGVDQQNPDVEVLQDAYIFTPAPLD